MNLIVLCVQAVAAAWETYNRQVAEYNAYQAQLLAQTASADTAVADIGGERA